MLTGMEPRRSTLGLGVGVSVGEGACSLFFVLLGVPPGDPLPFFPPKSDCRNLGRAVGVLVGVLPGVLLGVTCEAGWLLARSGLYLTTAMGVEFDELLGDDLGVPYGVLTSSCTVNADTRPLSSSVGGRTVTPCP